MPYRVAAGLLEHLLPVEIGMSPETLRSHTLKVGEQVRDATAVKPAVGASAITITLVGLRMPRALEIVDVIVRQLERGEATALEPRVRDATAVKPAVGASAITITLVGLRMPRALEIVDVIVRQLERGEATALEPRLRTALNAPPRRTPMP